MQLEYLIQLCEQKERKAQKSLVERFAPFLFSIGKRYMKDEAEAKDVLQEALVIILKNIGDFRGDPATFKSWISRITINVALSKFRKAYRQNEVHPGELVHTGRQMPEVYSDLNVEDILRMLDQLPQINRQVFNLFVVDGYRHAEIAEMLGIAESHSRTALTRARKMMQTLIKKSNKIRS